MMDLETRLALLRVAAYIMGKVNEAIEARDMDAAVSRLNAVNLCLSLLVDESDR